MEERSSMFAGLRSPLAMPALAEKQADVLRRTQDALIDELQKVTDRWCERRHKTVEAAFDLTRVSLQNAGPIGIAEAWLSWYKGTLHRLSEDASDQMELAVTLAQCCSNAVTISAEGTEAEREIAKRSARQEAETRH